VPVTTAIGDSLENLSKLSQATVEAVGLSEKSPATPLARFSKSNG